MVKKSTTKKSLPLRLSAIRVSRTTFSFIGLYMATIIIFDSWNLLSHEAVARRWTAIGLLLLVNLYAWYFLRTAKTDSRAKMLVLILVLAEIVFAGTIVYWERGMASQSAILFVLPLLTVGVLKSRINLLATATLCAAAYSLASVRYFNLHYGEGYRVQLWGQVVFYGGLIFVFTWLLMVLLRLRHDSE